MHINDKRVLYLLEYDSFAYCVLQLVSFLDHILFQTFNRIKLTTKLVLCQIYFAERASTNNFLQVEAFEIIAQFNH